MLLSIITSIKYELSGVIKQGSNIILNIVVKPNNKKNSILEIKEDYIKIGINALPVDGEANQELKSYVSEILDVDVADV